MGIHNLHKFLNLNAKSSIKEIHYTSLKDKVLAIDISIFLYQFASAIKNTTDDLKTSNGKITTHIQAILSKTLGMLKKKIKPIFIFDGKPPKLKNDVLNNRKNIKTNANEQIEKINKEIEQASEEEQIKLKEEKKKISKKTVNISRKQIEECKELLKILGIPIIEAREEADSQCAWLVKNNIAYGVASEDMDLLTFGTNKLIRKLSGKDNMIEYDLNIILQELDLNHNEFIDLCILLGCDYTDTIEGIGPKKAFDLIKKYRSIDNILMEDCNFINGKYKIPKNFNYYAAQNYFKNPPIIEINKDDISWEIPDFNKLRNLLITKYEYTEENYNKIVGILEGGYYSIINGSKKKNIYYKNMFDSDSD